MFRTDLVEFKIKQDELQRQADHIRLLKSIQRTNPLVSRFAGIVGRVLVNSGQLLISRSRDLS